MRARLVLLIVVLLIGAAGAQEGPRTWRVDFFETGGPAFGQGSGTAGAGVEAYSLDRVVVEPLPWPDRPEAAVDPVRGGNYRYDVVDAAGRVVLSRGFDPAFAEWVTTAEAKRVRR